MLTVHVYINFLAPPTSFCILMDFDDTVTLLSNCERLNDEMNVVNEMFRVKRKTQ